MTLNFPFLAKTAFYYMFVIIDLTFLIFGRMRMCMCVFVFVDRYIKRRGIW